VQASDDEIDQLYPDERRDQSAKPVNGVKLS